MGWWFGGGDYTVVLTEICSLCVILISLSLSCGMECVRFRQLSGISVVVKGGFQLLLQREVMHCFGDGNSLNLNNKKKSFKIHNFARRSPQSTLTLKSVLEVLTLSISC